MMRSLVYLGGKKVISHHSKGFQSTFWMAESLQSPALGEAVAGGWEGLRVRNRHLWSPTHSPWIWCSYMFIVQYLV